MTLAEKVTFVSVNLRGAQLAEKRRDVLKFLKQKRYSIYFFAGHTFYKERGKLHKKSVGF